LNVPECRRMMDRRVGHNHHDISIRRKGINKGLETRITNFHALKLRLRLAATQFELFDNIGNFSKRCASKCGVRLACGGVSSKQPSSIASDA